MDYSEDPRFSGYVLENSFVLGVHVGLDWAVVEIDACISKTHPKASELPKSGEWAVFQPAQLWFKRAKVEFERSGAPATLDADDSWDYGSIDQFKIEGDQYLLEGEFGRLKATSADAYVKEFSDG